jgi:hypothetical protein
LLCSQTFVGDVAFGLIVLTSFILLIILISRSYRRQTCHLSSTKLIRISRKDFSTLVIAHWKFEFSQRSTEIEETEYDDYPDIEQIILKGKGITEKLT